LGLAVCKGIVEVHHGQIRAEHREGGGTTFVVTLPLDAEETAPAERTA
jgi:two-component system sensor histidine kinase KdpD